MSERARNVSIAVALIGLAVAMVFLIATAPSDVDRVEELGSRIKCPVCQGESIANSPSQMARDMMSLVEERVAAGESDEAIVEELLSSYTGAVLLDPPASGSTLVLWLAPIAAVIVGGAVIYWWRRSPEDAEAESPAPAKSSSRRLLPIVILGVAFAGVVVTAGFFLQERSGAASGVADLGDQDLDDVSNETMEAVIAANADHPQVDGMRLALAERYYEAGDFSSAFPHYLSVAESANADGQQVVTALVRLGWMAWEGNGEADAAIGLFDQALAIDPAGSTAKYLKARVLWCGAVDPDLASELFQEVLADPDLSEDARAQVQAEANQLQAGGGCA